MTLFAHEMRRGFKSLLIWSLVVGLLCFSMLLMYVTFASQMESFTDLFRGMGAFSAAFGLDRLDFTTAIGYYGVEVGVMLAVGGAMFAALTGMTALAGEEGGRTAEFLLTQPVQRSRVVGMKLLAVLAQVALFNIVCVACSLLGFLCIAEPLPAVEFALYHAAQLLMQMEIACLCFACSAFLRRTQYGLGLGIALLMYFLSLFVNIAEEAAPLRFVTPFIYADAANILSGDGLDAGLTALHMGYAALAVGVAFGKYTRKDIAA